MPLQSPHCSPELPVLGFIYVKEDEVPISHKPLVCGALCHNRQT
jgi:hypothetical protein